MRKTFRNIEHVPIMRCKFHSYPVFERLRVGPQINGYIVDGTPGTANDFSFRVWLGLKMHASQSSFLDIERNVALNQCGVKALIFKFFLAPATRKKTSLVRVKVETNFE